MRTQSVLLFVLITSWLAVGPTTGFAQSQSPEAQPTSTGAAGDTSPGQAQATPKTKPRKVWTNDDISTMTYSHANPTSGAEGLKNVSAASTASRPENDPTWYREQLAPLNTEIARLDPQIAKLRAFLSGEKISDPSTTHRQLVPSPKDQLRQMERKRNADAAKIDELLDRARHNGIEPGQLR